MKHSGLTPLLVSATLFLAMTAAASLSGQDTMASTPASKAAKRAGELLKRYDKNGDGKLDDDERADAKEAMLKEQVDRQMARLAALPGGLEPFRVQVLEMFDKNRDGQLDENEKLAAQKFAEMRQDGGADSAELIKRFDRNGDGTIDASERAVIENFLKALRGLAPGEIKAELIRRFDRNADGKIDEGEMVELEAFVRPRIEANPMQVRRHDRNSDGKLDEAEWVVARGLIGQWLNASGPAALDNESMKQESSARPQSERDRPSLSQPADGTKPNAAREEARLKSVADEVARRRAERAAAKKATLPK